MPPCVKFIYDLIYVWIDRDNVDIKMMVIKNILVGIK